MILKLYLLSALICCLSLVLIAMAFRKDLKKNGYKPWKQNISMAKRISEYTKIALMLFFPVYNVIMMFVVLVHADEIYDNVKDRHYNKES